MINDRITDNSNEIQKIIYEHVLLIRILINNKNLKENVSKNYITKFINTIIILNDRQQIYNYWNSPTHQNFENSIQKVVFSSKNVVDLFFLHILNLYLLLSEKDFNSFINQIQNKLKIIIASYIKIAQKVSETKNLLIPLSFITIFTNLYGQSIQINNFGHVQLNEIFNIENNFEDSFVKYVEILQELNILYDFLIKIDESQNQLKNNYTIKLLKTILENNLYYEKMLIDFCILFSSKVPNEYKKTLTKKNKENEYWYKDLIFENLSEDEEALYVETLEFLNFVENWYENQEINKKVKEFIKNNIDKIFKDENIYEIFKFFIEKKESFNLNYTTKDIGRLLIENFIEIETENEKNSFIFSHINKLFSQKEIELFASKLFGKIIDILEKVNNFQYEILKQNKFLLKIKEKQIVEFFNKLIDIRNNKIPFFIFKLIIENNENDLSENLKEDFRNKLVEIKENVELEGIIKIIDEILDLI